MSGIGRTADGGSGGRPDGDERTDGRDRVEREEMADRADRATAKRDRLARFYRVLRALEGRGEQGATPDDIARIAGVSRRTVYRDLRALESELGIPLWSEGGRWGVAERGLLPPLHLTLAEATAVFLSARLMARYADDYDPDLGGAFQKLAGGLPAVLAEHVERTVDLMARRPLDERSNRHVHLLTRAWAERRVVTFVYDPGAYDPGRTPRPARVRPYLIEPSLSTRALYLIGWDETRNAIRTFKIERLRDLTVTAETFEPPAGSAVEESLARAWDLMADLPEVDVVLRFDPGVAGRILETVWHPSQSVVREPDGSLTWRARLSGTIEVRLWILSWGADVEVIAPAELRADVAATHRAAARRYDGSE